MKEKIENAKGREGKGFEKIEAESKHTGTELDCRNRDEGATC